jgi:hypothetical protein
VTWEDHYDNVWGATTDDDDDELRKNDQTPNNTDTFFSSQCTTRTFQSIICEQATVSINRHFI